MRGCAWGQGSHSSLITLASLSQQKRGESPARGVSRREGAGAGSAAGLAASLQSLLLAPHSAGARHMPTEAAPAGCALPEPQRWLPGSSRAAARGEMRPQRGWSCLQSPACPRAPSQGCGTRLRPGELYAPLPAPVRFTACPSLFKDSRSRLRWGLQKELCVEAANL